MIVNLQGHLRCIESTTANSFAYQRDLTVHAAFEQVVAAHPHRRAATFEGESLTYAELNAAANRVAQRLRDLGIERDSLVACCCTRSLGLIVALLGIMKAGGAYVPIDPEYPSERVTYMLDDVEPRALVGTADALARLSVETNLPTIALDANVPTLTVGTRRG